MIYSEWYWITLQVKPLIPETKDYWRSVSWSMLCKLLFLLIYVVVTNWLVKRYCLHQLWKYSLINSSFSSFSYHSWVTSPVMWDPRLSCGTLSFATYAILFLSLYSTLPALTFDQETQWFSFIAPHLGFFCYFRQLSWR